MCARVLFFRTPAVRAFVCLGNISRLVRDAVGAHLIPFFPYLAMPIVHFKNENQIGAANVSRQVRCNILKEEEKSSSSCSMGYYGCENRDDASLFSNVSVTVLIDHIIRLVTLFNLSVGSNSVPLVREW